MCTENRAQIGCNYRTNTHITRGLGEAYGSAWRGKGEGGADGQTSVHNTFMRMPRDVPRLRDGSVKQSLHVSRWEFKMVVDNFGYLLAPTLLFVIDNLRADHTKNSLLLL